MSISLLINKIRIDSSEEDLALRLHEFRNTYVEDNRVELYEIRKALDTAPLNGHEAAVKRLRSYIEKIQKNMDAVVLVVPAVAVEGVENSEFAVLKAKPLSERLVSEEYSICSDGLYSRQPSAMFTGTGFFVRNNVIATAAHVVVGGGKKIGDLRFIQGVQIDELEYFRSGILVKKDQVFKPVLTQDTLPPGDYELFSDGSDWAMVQVTGAFSLGKSTRTPAPVQIQPRPVEEGERLYSVGHGLGLPAKVSFWGKVFKLHKKKNYFECNLTLVGGSSGSPIFSAKDHRLIGIYMRGTKKLQLDPVNKCYFVKNEKDLLEGQECQVLHEGTNFFNRLQAFD